MPSRLLALTFDAHDPARLAGFWAGVMRRAVVDDLRGALLPGSDTQVHLRFTPSGAEKVGPNRVHLHLTSTSPAEQQDTEEAEWCGEQPGGEHADGLSEVAGQPDAPKTRPRLVSSASICRALIRPVPSTIPGAPITMNRTT